MNNVQMKYSGVEWIGDIPKNWSVKRIKDVSIVSTGQTPPREDIECFSGERENNFLWIKPEDLNSFLEISETKEYISKYGLQFIKLYNEKSIILSGIGAGLGNVGISKLKFTTNQQNHIISKHKNFKYLFYFMFAAKEHVKSLSVGNVIPILNATKLKNILVLNPSLLQQTAIANYLDHHTTKLDKEIYLLEQKVEKLDEFKQSLIYETVTKGLDKNVPMKYSGIEWVGMIPEHWEVKRVKDLFSTLKKSLISSSEADEDGKYDFYISGAKLKKSNSFNLTKEALLLPTGGSYMVHYPKTLPCSYSTDVLPIVVNKKINLKFAFYLLSHNKSYFNENYFWGSGLKHLQRNAFFNSEIIITSKNEQQQIVEYLDEQCSKIDKKRGLINKKIELLKEYKQSLIYEAVTGKINTGE